MKKYRSWLSGLVALVLVLCASLIAVLCLNTSSGSDVSATFENEIVKNTTGGYFFN